MSLKLGGSLESESAVRGSVDFSKRILYTPYR